MVLWQTDRIETKLPMHKNRIHLLYLTAEQWPTFRPDVVALFGKYLPRHGITCDLVTERDFFMIGKLETSWGGGQAVLCNVPRNRAGQYFAKSWHNLRTLITMGTKEYDAIQVRDMSLTALAGLVVARMKGIRFFYWLSYPQSEGQIDRAKSRGLKGGMRFWFPLIQGTFGKWLLYRVVLPRADHVFVQSRRMQVDIARHGIPMAKMTPVPMGVDTETASAENILPADHPRLGGRRVVAYLGTMDQIRHIEILFHMLALVQQQIPNILLVLVGDTEDASHRYWLKREAERAGVTENVLWLGWLPATKAWRYVRAAEIGLSPIPRGILMDMGSPTKAVEYMALGLPVVANDNPDQAQVIAESGAGICVPLQESAFAEAVIDLLNSPETMRQMGAKGREYVKRQRGYDSISKMVAQVYLDLGSSNEPERCNA
jgi:glycosyltransferase involved in cell wall biosynthesis